MPEYRKKNSTSIITGLYCPRCGHGRAEKTTDTSGIRSLRCCRCGHAWAPGSATG